jgi:hypothetical protein
MAGVDAEVLKYVFAVFVTFCVAFVIVVSKVTNWFLERQSASEEHVAANEKAWHELIQRLYDSMEENTKVNREFAGNIGRFVEFSVGHEQKSNMRHEALIKTLEGVEMLLQVLVKNGGKL